MGVSMKIVPDNGTERRPMPTSTSSVIDEIYRSAMKQLRSQIGVVDRMKDKSSTTVMDGGLHSGYQGEKMQNSCLLKASTELRY
ncbi:hypothetical protein K443DRAFT_677120 [Laccaria amethystina LaAM-08-1]|uniref:Uncharacterized protein n=1 Tax=Laccaria amethystina LaAM-08-1 TaxID=1095629 RepID=A0A0C9WUN9_9AGAR|nr:hypothetical protein K443DRAFT_677120 [Laccaria amethystina LaAM-08-1]